MTRFAVGLTVTGIIGFLLLEALKILMAPITAWLMGLLTTALKVVLVTLGIALAAVGIALAIGVSIVLLRRSRSSREA